MVCRRCHEQFDSWETEQFCESVPYGGHYLEVPLYAACPRCGSTDIVQETYCPECGEILSETEAEEGLCEICARDLVSYLREQWLTLSPQQRRWVGEHPEEIIGEA